MVRIEVKPLFKLSRAVVCETLKSAINSHHQLQNNCGSCTALPTEAEICPVIAELKGYFNSPDKVLNSIFNNVWGIFSHAREPFTLIIIYCFLLENPELRVSYFVGNFSHPNEQLFLRKYGKYLTSLNYKSRDIVHEESDLWRTGFRYTRNLQSLDLSDVSTSLKNELFGYIGLECVQIEEIDLGFSRNDNKDLDPVKFRKLCFRIDSDGNEMKTECCNTLKWINIPCDDEHQSINEIIALLLRNMNNLESLGPYFYPDQYFRFLERSGSDIFKTSLQIIFLDGPIIEYTLLLLKMFCPGMRALSLDEKSISNEKFINLNCAFPNLKSLWAKITSEEVPAKMITVPATWSSLKNLTLDFDNNSYVVDLSVFAEQMPALEYIRFNRCHQLKWDNVTRFKSLEIADFRLNKLESISWIISFSATIARLDLYFPDRYLLDKNSLNYLLTADFPKLQCINIEHFLYDFDFLSEVVQKCPSLKRFVIQNLTYPFSDDVSEESYHDRNEADLFGDLKKFVKDNNYKCYFVRDDWS